jgi:hypothetical protein
LTDQEKEKKLENAMPKNSEKEYMPAIKTLPER